MSKRILAIASLFFLSLSLFSLDMNEANHIIEEASKATEGLQENFDTLNQEETQEIETPVLLLTETNITTKEINQTKKEELLIPDNIIEVKEINSSTIAVVPENNISSSMEPLPLHAVLNEQNSTTELNLTQSKHESNITIEEPHTIVETNTTVTKSEESNITLLEINSTIEDDNLSKDEHYETEGSATRGLVIFKTHLKKLCGMTGEEFAKNYTQEDWDDIYDAKEFQKVVLELCPKMEGKYKERWTPHLYQFSLKYASDSDEIPEC